MTPHQLFLAICILLMAFHSAKIVTVEASITPIVKNVQLRDELSPRSNKVLAPLKAPAKDEDTSEEKKSEEDEEEDDEMMIPSGPSSKDGGKSGKNKKPSSSDDEDDIMKDLLNPNKTSGTPKPTVIMNGNGKNKKPIGAAKTPDDESRSEDLKEVMDSAMAKATSIATNIGDAIKAALNSVATALKNATDVTQNSKPTVVSSSASCHPPSKGAISTTPLNMKNPAENCSGNDQPLETTMASSNRNGPVPATTTTRRQRRHSEVAKWPPLLPYSYGPHETHLLFDGDDSSDAESNSQGSKITGSMEKSTNGAAQHSEGGIISHGQVGSEEESGSEEASHQSSSSTSEIENTETAEIDDSSSSGSSGGGDDQINVTSSPDDDTEGENGSSMSKTGGMDNGNKNAPKTGSPTTKTTAQRNTTVTITGSSGVTGDSMGSSSISSSSSSSSSAFPPYPVIKKPGKCRPLTKGLSCIALAPDASQCSTDNGCPGTKKCCYYGCAPYTGVGICEFPVM